MKQLARHLKKGDHIMRWGADGAPVDHHGIYIGRGKVIHFVGGKPGSEKQSVALTTVNEFMGTPDAGLARVVYPTELSPDEIIQKAKLKLGRDGYDLLSNNCETFAFECRSGSAFSYQVLTFMFALAGGIWTVFFNGGLAVLYLTAMGNTFHRHSVELDVIKESTTQSFMEFFPCIDLSSGEPRLVPADQLPPYPLPSQKSRAKVSLKKTSFLKPSTFIDSANDPDWLVAARLYRS